MEYKRILLGKPFLLFLLALLVINTWFFVYQSKGYGDDFRQYGNIYHETVEEYSSLGWEEGLEKSVQFCDDVLQQLINDEWSNTIEDNFKLNAVEEMEKQYTYLLGYADYLQKVQDNAKNLQSVSLFSKPGTFAYENTVKTAKDFKTMEGVTVTFGHDLAVTKVFEDGWTDFCVLLPVILVCCLFLAERRGGLWSVIHGASGGRSKLAAKRVGIMLAASFISVIFLSGSKILLCGYVYHGFGEWGRVLQSIPDFYNVPTPMTIGEFWLRYLIVKIFGVFFVGLVLWLIMSCVSNFSLALGAGGIFIGLEYLCTLILPSSIFAAFRYINIFSYIQYCSVLTKYLNLSFFGKLISGHDLICVILPFLCVGFIVLDLLAAEKKRPVSAGNILLKFQDAFRKKISFISGKGGIFVQECKKLMVDRKGFLLIIVIIVYLFNTGAPYRDPNPYDMYLDYYQEKYAGPITEEKISALQAELDKAQESDRIGALEQMISMAQRAPEGSWILPNAPYEAIFTDQQYHRTSGLAALLFLVLILAPIMSQERQADMKILLHGTAAGRSRLWGRKQLLLVLCTVLLWAMIYGNELLKTTVEHGAFSCFGAPLASLKIFEFSGSGVTVFQAMALLYGRRLLVLLCSAEICCFLSELCKKNINAIVLGCGLIVFPAAIAAIGSKAGETVSFLMPLAQVDVLPSLFPFVPLLIMGIASVVLTLRMSQKYVSP
ncbi:MAG: hypothetical protein HDT44_02250 [Ruminococcaceae bacterium]|nr:hypothetical protein [Oscillospiraceae bacterium]